MLALQQAHAGGVRFSQPIIRDPAAMLTDAEVPIEPADWHAPSPVSHAAAAQAGVFVALPATKEFVVFSLVCNTVFIQFRVHCRVLLVRPRVSNACFEINTETVLQLDAQASCLCTCHDPDNPSMDILFAGTYQRTASVLVLAPGTQVRIDLQLHSKKTEEKQKREKECN